MTLAESIKILFDPQENIGYFLLLGLKLVGKFKLGLCIWVQVMM